MIPLRCHICGWVPEGQGPRCFACNFELAAYLDHGRPIPMYYPHSQRFLDYAKDCREARNMIALAAKGYGASSNPPEDLNQRLK